jgi:hypothetical protein
MAKLSDFENYAAKYNGGVVAWINQGDIIAGTDARGVCLVIVQDWIESCRLSWSKRVTFVKKFTGRDKDGKFDDSYVPKDYLDRQDAENRKVALAKAELEKRGKKAKELEKKGQNDAARAELEAAWTHLKKTIGGDDCRQLAVRHSFKQVVDSLKKITEPCYIALSLNAPARWTLKGRKDFGHTVGIELRPDIPMFEFLDANSGLFAFTKLDDMIAFLQDIIWPGFYQSKNVTAFGFYFFDAGLTLKEIKDSRLQEELKNISRDLQELLDPLDAEQSQEEIPDTDERKDSKSEETVT